MTVKIKDVTDGFIKEIEALKAERDALLEKFEELSAKVEGLTKANSRLSQIENQQGRINALECALDCLQFEAHLIAGVSEGLDKTLADTLVIHNACSDEMTSGCLLDVQAEAGRAGFFEGYVYALGSVDEIDIDNANCHANEYAATIRQGVEK